MRSRDAAHWQFRLDEEIDNLRSAHAYFMSHGCADENVRLVTTIALEVAHTHRGARFAELYGWLAAINKTDASDSQWARVLLGRALIGNGSLRFAECTALFEQGVALFADLGDSYGEAVALASIRQHGTAFRPISEHTGALHRSLGVLDEAADKRSCARLLLCLGLDDPELTDAQRDAHFALALQLSEACNDLDGKILVLQETAWSLLCRSDFDAAETVLAEAVRLAKSAGRTERQAGLMWLQAKTYGGLGRMNEGRALLIESVRVLESLGLKAHGAATDLGMGFAASGDLEQARHWFEIEPSLPGLCNVLVCLGQQVAPKELRARCAAYFASAQRDIADGDALWSVVSRWDLQSAHHFLAVLASRTEDTAGMRSHLASARAAAADTNGVQLPVDQSASANRELVIMARLAQIKGQPRLCAQLARASEAAVLETDFSHVPEHERRFQKESIAKMQSMISADDWHAGRVTAESTAWQQTLDTGVALLLR